MTRAAAALLGVALLGGIVAAETASPDSAPMLRLTATTSNVSGAPDSIRIDLFRWSTDAEREKLMDAWALKPGAVAAGANGRGNGRGGRGGAAAGRGGAASGARGARGRGGTRGGAPAAPPTPEGQLTLALQEATTIGYLWSSEAAGYAVRYAGEFAQSDGGERIILITDRRLGGANALWRAPNQISAAPYDFSIIELRVNAKGTGEGKISIGEKVAPDAAAGIVALPDYDSLPVVLAGVKKAKP